MSIHYASGQDLTNPEISPIFGEFDHTFPNFFISTGTRDLLMSQSVLLANKLKASDISVELNIWEGLWHVFEWNMDLPESTLSLKQISDFLIKSFPSRILLRANSVSWLLFFEISSI